LILQNQSDFHEQLQNNNKTLNSIEDNEVNVMSQFPIETDNTLNQLEEALTDNNYCNKLVKQYILICYIVVYDYFFFLQSL